MIELLRQVGFTPRSCVWELTLACNLRCKHCGSIAGKRREDELSLEENLDLADQLAALGCKRITLSGGEPTLHPNWDTIGKRLVDRGVRVNLISNGWHWDASHVARAKAAGLCGAAFSVDGFRAEHDDFRQAGSFDRVMAAIDACVTGGLPVAVNTTVHKKNQHCLRELREFLIGRGVFSIQVQLATASGNMNEHRDLVVDPADLVTLVPELASLCRLNHRRFFMAASDDIGYYGKPEQGLRDDGGELPFWLGCRAGCQVIGIESNGTIKGCLSLPSSMHGENRFVEGNVREKTLAEIWNGKNAFAFTRLFSEKQLTGFCRVCRYREFCRGGCSWTVHTHTKEGGEGNPFCFYFQAVKQGRLDLLTEEPTAAELAYFGREAAEAAASAAPSNGQDLMREAQKAVQERRFEHAHALLEQAQAVMPDDLAVIDLLGYVCFSLGDFAAAEAHNRRALALSPNHAYAYNGLGLCLARLGKLDEGLAAIEHAIALRPTWFEPYHDMGVVFAEAGQIDKAIDVLDRGAVAAPESKHMFVETKRRILARVAAGTATASSPSTGRGTTT
jgi:radical SAM protein with 4Fe4S-binding SPASM domain